MTAARCTNCTTTWTGAKIAHCAGCHQTFTTVSNFDRHRRTAADNRICVQPVDAGLVQNTRGQWLTPHTTSTAHGWTARPSEMAVAA